MNDRTRDNGRENTAKEKQSTDNKIKVTRSTAAGNPSKGNPSIAARNEFSGRELLTFHGPSHHV